MTPKQIQLVKEAFPNEPWAKMLVDAFNQLSAQVTQAASVATKETKSLKFTTGASVATSFPLDIPVERIPTDVRVSQVIGAVGSGANAAQWAVLARNSKGVIVVRISLITGLLPSTKYEVRLTLE